VTIDLQALLSDGNVLQRDTDDTPGPLDIVATYAAKGSANTFTADQEINGGGFTNSLDSVLWVAGANRSGPTVASQGIYVQHRVTGDAGAVVHDATASELRVNGITNSTYLNGHEVTAAITGGANTIADMRALTANYTTSGSPSGTITAASVIRTQTVPALSGTLAITTLYSLYVEAQTVGATNYTIYAPSGQTVLGPTEMRGATSVGEDATAAVTFSLRSTTTTHPSMQILKGGNLRWIVRTTGTESGSNAGSDLEIVCRTDAGGALNTPLTIVRSTAGIKFGSGPLGFFAITPVAKKTGWGTATGTATRTTFDTTTVTLPQLAERVAALIDDLHATAGYGLIAT
jgi:hypothetical protein